MVHVGVLIIISTNPQSCNLAVYLLSCYARARLLELCHVIARNCRGAGRFTSHDLGGGGGANYLPENMHIILSSLLLDFLFFRVMSDPMEVDTPPPLAVDFALK